jgi:hypothetical protein
MSHSKLQSFIIFPPKPEQKKQILYADARQFFHSLQLPHKNLACFSKIYQHSKHYLMTTKTQKIIPILSKLI